MQIYDLLKDSADAIAEDTTIQSWCQSIFGNTHTVIIDEDIRNPGNDAPAVRLHSPYKRANQEVREIDHGFYAYIMVNASEDALGPHINIDQFQATQHLMTFITYIISAINTAKPAVAVMEYDLETDTITNFPFFEADLALSFMQPLTIGQNPLTV